MSNDVADDDMAKTIKKIIVDVTGFLDKVIDALYKATSILGKDGLPNFQKKTVEVALKILGKLKEIIDKELDRIQPREYTLILSYPEYQNNIARSIC